MLTTFLNFKVKNTGKQIALYSTTCHTLHWQINLLSTLCQHSTRLVKDILIVGSNFIIILRLQYFKPKMFGSLSKLFFLNCWCLLVNINCRPNTFLNVIYKLHTSIYCITNVQYLENPFVYTYIFFQMNPNRTLTFE